MPVTSRHGATVRWALGSGAGGTSSGPDRGVSGGQAGVLGGGMSSLALGGAAGPSVLTHLPGIWGRLVLGSARGMGPDSSSHGLPGSR